MRSRIKIKTLKQILLNPRKLWFKVYTFFRRKPYHLSTVVVLGILASVGIIAWHHATVINLQNRYKLTAAAQGIIGPPDTAILPALAYNAKTASYDFNSKGINKNQQGVSGSTSTTVGTSSSNPPFSFTLGHNLNKGVSIYDDVSKLSFQITPLFQALPAKNVNNHIVYPLTSNNAQSVYTLKGDGLEEDILINKPVGNQLSFRYKLSLPNTLQARLTSDGDIGIYSADSALFGNISFGTPKDEKLVQQARTKGKKNTLVFVLPAPVLKSSLQTRQLKNAKVELSLKGDIVTLSAINLQHISYPFAIDPSVLVVNAIKEFTANGNNEGGITFDNTNNDIYEQLLGSGVSNVNGGFSPDTNSLGMGTYDATSVVYNGYIYLLGGCSGTCGSSTLLNTVQYSKLSATSGNPGAWSTSTFAMLEPMYGEAAVVYNGNLYIGGGCVTNSSNECTFIIGFLAYVPINAKTQSTNGGLPATTAWNIASLITGAQYYGFQMLAYNNYLYVLGGCSGDTSDNTCTTFNNEAEHFPINGDGTLGAVVTDPSFTTARFDFGAGTYNGHIYIWGGCSTANCSTPLQDVQYASIGSNGNLSTWTSNASTGSWARWGFNGFIYNGYLYVIDGCSATTASGGSAGTCTTFDSDVNEASINADGSVNAFRGGGNIAAPARFDASGVAYEGYLYVLGGCNTESATTCTHVQSDDQLAQLDIAGSNTDSLGTGNNPSTPIVSGATVAYNGFIYEIGGCTVLSQACPTTAGDISTTIQYSALPSDGSGSLGTWSTCGSATPSTAMPASIVNFSAATYNGRLYILGGYVPATTNTNTTIYYDTFNTGSNPCFTSGTWSTTTDTFSSAVAPGDAAVQVYQNYIYLIGGCTSYGSGYCQSAGLSSNILYAPISSSGDITTAWTTASGALPAATTNLASAIYGNYIYILGGCTVVTSHLCSSISNKVYVSVITPSTGVPNSFSRATTEGGGVNSANLNTASWGLNAWVYDGTLYEDNGCTSSSSSVCSAVSSTNDLYFSSLNNDTTLNTAGWSATSISPAGRYNGGIAMWHDQAYYVGGYYVGTSAFANTKVTEINSGGPATLSSWAASANNYSTIAREGSRSVAYNGYMYVVGGYTGSSYSTTVDYAQISASGSLGSFNHITSGTGSLLTGVSEFCLEAYNGYLYVIGGQTGANSATANVYYSQINSGTGAPGAFTAGTNLPSGTYPTGLSGMGCAVNNGYLYVLGGTNDASSPTYYNNVYYSQINLTSGATCMGAAGINCTWTPTNALGSGSSNQITGLAAVVDGGYMYVLGGYNGTTDNNTVSSALINTSTGALNSFANTGFFNGTRKNLSAFGYDGYLYVIGGDNCLGDVQETAIGTLGQIQQSWQHSPTLNTTVNDGTVTAYNGWAYEFGGISGGSCTTSQSTTTQQAAIKSIPRIGIYSSYMDQTSSVQPLYLVTDGTTAGNEEIGIGPYGGVEEQYEFAGSGLPSGCVTYNSQAAVGTNTAPFNQPYPIGLSNNTDGCGNTTNLAEYLFLSYTLDDTLTTTFPEIDNVHTTITSFQFFYHPNPGSRLRGGATFTGGVLQGLDTPP